jgi:hypothetical protein
MSTSPDRTGRADDRLVSALSEWLAGHTDDDKLRARIREVGTDELSPQQAEAVDELLAELDQPEGSRGDLEMVARETLEALALGA